MSYSRRSRFSHSPSPYKRYSRSISGSPPRSRSRDSSDTENPGNNLYVTGLSTRVSRRDLEKHFATEGKVEDVRLVVDPWTQESRGFGFVTMYTVEEADRCVKYLDRSVLQGRVITVEKAIRRRGRTPTPGRYLGLRTVRARRGSTYSRSVSPSYSSERERGSSGSSSPYFNRGRQSYSPYSRRRPYAPYYRRRRSCSRSPSCSKSPVRRQDQYSPTYHRYYSPYGRYYRRHYCSSPETPEDYKHRRSRRDNAYCSSSPETPYDYKYRRRRSLSRSISPVHGRRYKRRYSRSISPRRSRRSYSLHESPKCYRRSCSQSVSHGGTRSSRSHSRSPNEDSTSQSG